MTRVKKNVSSHGSGGAFAMPSSRTPVYRKPGVLGGRRRRQNARDAFSRDFISSFRPILAKYIVHKLIGDMFAGVGFHPEFIWSVFHRVYYSITVNDLLLLLLLMLLLLLLLHLKHFAHCLIHSSAGWTALGVYRASPLCTFSHFLSASCLPHHSINLRVLKHKTHTCA